MQKLFVLMEQMDGYQMMVAICVGLNFVRSPVYLLFFTFLLNKTYV